jgi:hypothetical protein
MLPRGTDQLHDLGGIRLFGRKVVESHVGAFAREGEGGGAANAGIPARDTRLASG